MADVSVSIRFTLDDKRGKWLMDLNHFTLCDILRQVVTESMDNDKHHVSFGDLKVKLDDDISDDHAT